MRRIHANPGRRSVASRCGATAAACARRGVTVVENAIVISVFLVILLGTLDLGLAVLKYNTLAEAARRLGRSATVHGEKAAPEITPWGPSTCSGAADDGSPYAEAFRDVLVTMKPADVQYELEWLDEDNRTGNRVRVELRTAHDTILPFLFGSGGLQLTATSVMRIEH